MAIKISEMPELPDAVDLGDGYVPVARLGQKYRRQLGNKRTAAEVSAGITPVNYAIDPTFFDPRRYGAVGDGVTNDATALQTALNVAGVNGGTVKLPAGVTFFCTSNLTVPIGTNTAVDIEGSSWTHGGIKFSGAAVTTGLTFTGSGYSYAGEVRNLRIYCVSGAKRGITFTDLNHPRVTRCAIQGAAGAGVVYNTTLMGELNSTLFVGCGSATEASVEVFGISTTWKWDHSRISAGNTTIGGLLIDQTTGVMILGGAIESIGTPIKLASKAIDSQMAQITISGVDLENPGNGNFFITAGAGLTTQFVSSVFINNVNTSLAGTANVAGIVSLTRCVGWEFVANNFGTPTGATAFHVLNGTANQGIVIRTQRQHFGGTIPWATVGGTQRKAAGPVLDWNNDTVPIGYDPQDNFIPSLMGATPSILVSATQGAFYRRAAMSNGGATTVTALTGGESGMGIYLTSPNGNTTLTHSTSTADQFWIAAGANLVMVTNQYYHFIHNGTLWVQI